MLTNGDFENSSSPIGWTMNPGTCSGSNFGVTNNESHSLTQSFCDTCDSQIVSISQSFSSIVNQVYNIHFWYYFTCNNGSGSPSPIEILVTLN